MYKVDDSKIEGFVKYIRTILVYDQCVNIEKALSSILEKQDESNTSTKPKK